MNNPTKYARHFFFCRNKIKTFFQDIMLRVLGNYPDGSSIYSIAHYGQMINTGEPNLNVALQNFEDSLSGIFRKFDYGPEGNHARYGQASAPEFNVSRATCPLAFFCGLNDALSPPEVSLRYFDALSVLNVFFFFFRMSRGLPSR